MSLPSRQQLVYVINRRKLFPALLRELFVVAGAVQGNPGLSLSDLADLPDEQLAQIVPSINPEFEITVVEDHLWSRNIHTDLSRQHFVLNPTNILVFNQFDGVHTLGEIRDNLAATMAWEMEAAFAYVVDLFLSLVRYYVALPANAPE